MKFLTLLQKELRESLPYILGACIVLLLAGLLSVQGYLKAHPHHNTTDEYWSIHAGQQINFYDLAPLCPFASVGGWLVGIACALGLGLGILHFWVPQLTRTWPFLIHRSVTKPTIVSVKLTAACSGILLGLGGAWACVYGYGRLVKLVRPVPNHQVFWDGTILLTLGLVCYLGAAVSGLCTRRWYTTKLAGLAFALLLIMLAFSQRQLSHILTVVGLGLLIQVFYVYAGFSRKQF